VVWKEGLSVVLIIQDRGEIAVIFSVTAVLLHHSAIDTGAEFSVVSTG